MSYVVGGTAQTCAQNIIRYSYMIVLGLARYNTIQYNTTEVLVPSHI